jgi:transposase
MAVDMVRGHTRWVEGHFPEAAVDYNHFHVIKLMNERLDQIRREAMHSAATDP